MRAPAATKWIYDFDEGSRELRDLLGGKGSGIAEMTRLLGAELVPAGFTITTEACVEYMRAGRTAPDGLVEAIDDALTRLEERAEELAVVRHQHAHQKPAEVHCQLGGIRGSRCLHASKYCRQALKCQ